MKITNEEIITNVSKLVEISQRELPVKVSYAIAKNIAKIESVLKIYNTERSKLLEKYSVKDEQGKSIITEDNQIKLQEEFTADWNKDIRELDEIENDIDIHTFSINALEGFNITPRDIKAIQYMIEE